LYFETETEDDEDVDIEDALQLNPITSFVRTEASMSTATSNANKCIPISTSSYSSLASHHAGASVVAVVDIVSNDTSLIIPSQLDEGSNIDFSTRLNASLCLTSKVELKIEVLGLVTSILLDEMNMNMANVVGLSKAFYFPFFNPDADADAPDTGGHLIIALIILLPLNVLQ